MKKPSRTLEYLGSTDFDAAVELETPTDLAGRLELLLNRSTLSKNGLVAICIGTCILVALFESWAARFAINPDAVSYLDLADSLLKHQWGQAFSPYFGFFYPSFLAVLLGCLKPSPAAESTFVHFGHFLTFLLSLVSFTWLLKEFQIFYRVRSPERLVEVPTWFFELTGYLVFFWSSFDLTQLVLLTPDFLVSSSVYSAAALLLRIHRIRCNYSVYALLGIVLALGYLSKTVMFPISLLLMPLACFGKRRGKDLIVAVFLLVFSFALTISPFIKCLSDQHRSFSFGESGRCNYL